MGLQPTNPAASAARRHPGASLPAVIRPLPRTKLPAAVLLLAVSLLPQATLRARVAAALCSPSLLLKPAAFHRDRDPTTSLPIYPAKRRVDRRQRAAAFPSSEVQGATTRAARTLRVVTSQQHAAQTRGKLRITLQQPYLCLLGDVDTAQACRHKEQWRARGTVRRCPAAAQHMKIAELVRGWNAPGGRDSFSLLAFSSSFTTSVYRYCRMAERRRVSGRRRRCASILQQNANLAGPDLELGQLAYAHDLHALGVLPPGGLQELLDLVDGLRPA